MSEPKTVESLCFDLGTLESTADSARRKAAADRIAAALDELAQLRATRDALKSALKKYGRHRTEDACAASLHRCYCGFDAALSMGADGERGT